ncbi:MAG: Ldh family oxidoreductase [Bacillota bacterium]|nr:Ldh family oxidoreductase [Bacillota bacterium]
METRPYVPWDVMENFMVQAFSAYGIPVEDAKICADVLLESDRRGIESHGCNRFKPIYIDRIIAGILNPVTKIDVIRDRYATAVLDANDGMGMVASKVAMDMAIEKAKKYGLGMVAVRNSSHYGIAGYWTSMAVKENMIGITGTNARPSIAPTFGVENMLGTNPLTFGIPTDEAFPFTLDCATSITQNGKIEFYQRVGKETPAGMVCDRNGEIMTDTDTILKYIRSKRAALAPLGGFGEELGGYKGYGYATVVEILCAALQNGIFLKDLEGKNEDGSIRPYHLGHFFIVINPDFFVDIDDFKKTTGDILRELRASQKAPGATRIYTAGEKEYEVWLDRKDKGVPVSEPVQKEMIAIRDAMGIDIHFDFED